MNVMSFAAVVVATVVVVVAAVVVVFVALAVVVVAAVAVVAVVVAVVAVAVVVAVVAVAVVVVVVVVVDNKNRVGKGFGNILGVMLHFVDLGCCTFVVDSAVVVAPEKETEFHEWSHE
jgi:hypothetical protein